MKSLYAIIFMCTIMSRPHVATQIMSHDDKAKNLLSVAQQNGLYHDSSAVYLHELRAHAEQEGLTYYLIESNYLLGKHYLLRLETRPAKEHFISAAEYARNASEHELYGFALDRLGMTYLREGLLDSALICFQRAIDTYQAHQLEHRQWNSLYGISRVFQYNGDYLQTRKYGEAALQSIANFDEEIAETILLSYLMSIASESGQIEDYAKYLDRYLQNLDPKELGKDQMHLAAYFSTNQDPQVRIRDISAAIAKLSTKAPTLSLLSGYFKLGEAHLELSQNKLAIEAWLTGLSLDQSVGGVGFALAFTEALSKAYEGIGDHKNALDYLKQNKLISDNLTNLANKRRLDELQVKYETSQKEQTILTQQFALEQGARQRNIFMLAGILIFGLGLMIIFVLRTRLHAQKVIASQEIQNLKQGNRLLSMKSMLRGQEEERKRIAFDLHDGLGGLLSTVKFQFQKLFDKPELSSLNGEVKNASRMLDDACREVRRIAHNMMPHALMKLGLNAAISDMVSVLHSTSGVDIEYHNLTNIDRLDEQREIMIYRIVQELVQNAIKHADASSILIQLSQHTDMLSLVVEDDGKGFDTTAATTNGLGFQSLDSRVQFLNGVMEIQSVPATGTTVSIEFALGDEGISPQPFNLTTAI